MLKSTREDIRYAYRLLLGREGDESGLASFADLVDRGGLSTVQLAQFFLESEEFRNSGTGVTDRTSSSVPPNMAATRLLSQTCTYAQLDSPNFRYWAGQLRDLPGRPQRKLWEWCYIVQALFERGMLADGRQGLGFAVGREPLTALFAQRGCEILATDLAHEQADKEGWVKSGEHATGLDFLNSRRICTAEKLAERVRFRPVDMKAIPADIGRHHFLWSSCAIEHLGSLRDGMDFVLKSADCLLPGGVAVHTTEFNCDSDDETIERGHDVIFRKRDFLALAAELRERGHTLAALDFDLGDRTEDRYVDPPPYTGTMHMKLRIGKFASTSFGLIVTAGVD